MILIRCPRCGWPLILPRERLGSAVSCVYCRDTFESQNARLVDAEGLRRIEHRLHRSLEEMRPDPANVPTAPAAPVAPPPAAALPPLTNPHRCSHCEYELPATGMRRTTVACPQCGRPASVYAVQFHCPECNVRLESPLQRVGRPCRCPACGEQLVVPSDALFNDDRAVPDHTWYSFACPACFVPLQTRPGHAGRTAVCPSCLHVLTVPAGGERFVDPPDPPARRTVTEVVNRSLDRPCRRCGLPVPLRSPQCCHCGVKIT